MAKNIEIFEAKDRDNELITELFKIWKSSVEATHLFLSQKEIEKIATYVLDALCDVERLAVARCDGEVAGFMGVDGEKIQMLFVKPKIFKKGVGKALVKYAFSKYLANEVCVNEQNPNAVKFYEHLGFKMYKRSEIDEQGEPYPILYMKI